MKELTIQGRLLSTEENLHMQQLATVFFKNLSLHDGSYNPYWGLDSKRPFGNKDLHQQILILIGYNKDAIWTNENQEELKEDLKIYAEKLYSNLGSYLRNMWTEVLNGKTIL